MAGEEDYKPLTPVMADEHDLDKPRAALADATRVRHLVEDLATLGAAALPDPQAALREARRLQDEKQAVVDAILDKMLHHPDQI